MVRDGVLSLQVETDADLEVMCAGQPPHFVFTSLAAGEVELQPDGANTPVTSVNICLHSLD